MNIRRTFRGAVLGLAVVCSPPVTGPAAADPSPQITRLSAEQRTRAIDAIDAKFTELLWWDDPKPRVFARR